MIKIFAVEIVDAAAAAGRAHIRVELFVLEEDVGCSLELIAIVPADNTFARRMIVRLTNARIKHHVRVAENERREYDETCRLFIFLTRFEIRIQDSGDSLRLLIVKKFGDEGACPKLEFWLRAEDGHDRHRRRRFGIRFARIAIAKTAILAGAERHAINIFVRRARVARGNGKWMIAETLRRRSEHQSAFGRFDWLVRILVAARPFEDVATVDFLSAQIAGLS